MFDLIKFRFLIFEKSENYRTKKIMTPTWLEHATFRSGVGRATSCATESYISVESSAKLQKSTKKKYELVLNSLN